LVNIMNALFVKFDKQSEPKNITLEPKCCGLSCKNCSIIIEKNPVLGDGQYPICASSCFRLKRSICGKLNYGVYNMYYARKMLTQKTTGIVVCKIDKIISWNEDKNFKLQGIAQSSIIALPGIFTPNIMDINMDNVQFDMYDEFGNDPLENCKKIC
jgi:hypothetical protein